VDSPSSVKSPYSDQLPAENRYFHFVFQFVFQYFKASIAKQSRTVAAVAAVAQASHDLETIFELFPQISCRFNALQKTDLCEQKAVNRHQISAEKHKNTVFREKHFSQQFEYGRIYLRIYGR